VLLASESHEFTHLITQPSGIPVGGDLRLKVFANGNYEFHLKMRNSGLAEYAFGVTATLGTGTLAAIIGKSGSVGGEIEGGDPEFVWSETGYSHAIRLEWGNLSGATLTVDTWTEIAGIVGDVIDLAERFVQFVVAQGLVGPYIAGLIIVGQELLDLTSGTVGPQGLTGIIIAGSIVLLAGPGMLIPAVAAGAVAGSSFIARQLTDSEKTIARAVFADSIDFSNVYVSNLSLRPEGNAHVPPPLPGGDVLICLGSKYQDEIGLDKTFIHELVHVWQLQHGTFDVERMWQLFTNQFAGHEAYEFSWQGQVWGEMNFEAQAAAVATWFWVFTVASGRGIEGLELPVAKLVPLYEYVERYIRQGHN
jgi:hypothetical protein